MNRALTIDPKTRQPRISEADTAKVISDLLQFKGWTEIITPAEGWLPSGRRIHKRGAADRAYVRRCPGCLVMTEFFWAEFKRPRARTKPQHAAEQAAFQTDMQARGLASYRCPDECADPVAHFQSWYLSVFGEDL